MRLKPKAEDMIDALSESGSDSVAHTYGRSGVCQRVSWISSLPGAGKTLWAINKMAKIIREHGPILIYAAPTHNLLQEVKKKVLRRLKDLPEDQKRIIVVDEELKSWVSSSRTTLKSVVRTIINGSELTGSNGAIPGTVILLTHETFLRLDSGYDIEGRSRFPKRDQIQVIFDEAQKCVLQSKNLKLPMDLVNLLDPYLGLKELPGARGPMVLKFRTEPLVASIERLTKDKGLSKINRATVHELDRFLTHAYGSNVKVLARASIVESSEKDSMQLSIQTLLDPARTFYGWKKVTLMAARLENSQMFHVLSRSSIEQLPDEDRKMAAKRLALTECPLDLRQLSVGSINRREALVRKVWSKTHMTYVCGGQSELSKLSLVRGVVAQVPDDFSTDIWHDDLKKVVSATSSPRRYTPQYLARIARATPLGNGRFHFGPWATEFPKDDLAVRNHVDTLPGLLSASPLQHMMSRTIRLNNLWNKIHHCEGPIPITINVRGESGEDMKSEVDRCGLVEGEAGDWVQVPFKSQGLNKFRGYHVMAFLAAINPRPEIKDLLSYLCPNYNSKLDHVVDQAVQSLARGSIRLPKVTAPRLLILADRATAELVHKEGFLGLPKLIDPWEISHLGNGLTKEEDKELRSIYSIMTLRFSSRAASSRRSAESERKKAAKRTLKEQFLATQVPGYVEYRNAKRRLTSSRPREDKIELAFKCESMRIDLEPLIAKAEALFKRKWADGDIPLEDM